MFKVKCLLGLKILLQGIDFIVQGLALRLQVGGVGCRVSGGYTGTVATCDFRGVGIRCSSRLVEK